jgi:hypothetical protein
MCFLPEKIVRRKHAAAVAVPLFLQFRPLHQRNSGS